MKTMKNGTNGDKAGSGTDLPGGPIDGYWHSSEHGQGNGSTVHYRGFALHSTLPIRIHDRRRPWRKEATKRLFATSSLSSLSTVVSYALANAADSGITVSRVQCNTDN